MADFNSKYTGEQVEALLDIVSQGGSGGGGEGGEVQKTTEAEIAAMGFTKNQGTITEVKMNGVSKGTSGVVDLGNVPTKAQFDAQVEMVNSLNDDVSGLYNNKQDTIADLATIREGASKGATAVQPNDISEFITVEDVAKVATTGSYNDLVDKPTIPSAVTESTVSGWGFTKNTGTYSKPSGGIPKNDLSSDVQSALTAAQSYKGTVNNITINGETKSPTNGVVDLGNVGTYSKPSAGIPKTDLASAVQTSLGKADTALQSHQDISGKQDKLVSGSNIKTINGQSILGSGNITIEGGGGSSSGGDKEVIVYNGWDVQINDALPNKIYILTNFEVETFEIISFTEKTAYDEYTFIFPYPAFGLSLPSDVVFANEVVPNVGADTFCELSIVGITSGSNRRYNAVLTTFGYL